MTHDNYGSSSLDQRLDTYQHESGIATPAYTSRIITVPEEGRVYTEITPLENCEHPENLVRATIPSEMASIIPSELAQDCYLGCE